MRFLLSRITRTNSFFRLFFFPCLPPPLLSCSTGTQVRKTNGVSFKARLASLPFLASLFSHPPSEANNDSSPPQHQVANSSSSSFSPAMELTLSLPLNSHCREETFGLRKKAEREKKKGKKPSFFRFCILLPLLFSHVLLLKASFFLSVINNEAHV